MQEIEQAKNQWENRRKAEYMKQAYEEGFQKVTKMEANSGYDEMDETYQSMRKKLLTSSKEEYEKHIESAEAMILELGNRCG